MRQLPTQLLRPVTPQAFACWPTDKILLAPRKVTVLGFDRRERRRHTRPKVEVELAQLVDEQHERPVVDSNMVRRTQQHMLVSRAPNDRHPQNRPAHEVEGPTALFG